MNAVSKPMFQVAQLLAPQPVRIRLHTDPKAFTSAAVGINTGPPRVLDQPAVCLTLWPAGNCHDLHLGSDLATP